MTDNPTPNEIALLREALQAQENAEDAREGCVNCDGEGMWEHCPSCSLRFGRAIDLRRAALAPTQHDDATAEGEAVAWCSPGQLANLTEVDADGGVYLPIRKTKRGNFTMALYAKPAPSEQARAEGERITKLIDQIEAGDFDELDAAADKWAAAASVQRMANAMASVFERYASQDIMDRFREKLGALMHLAFVEGAAQGVLQLRAASPSSDDAEGRV